MPLEGLKGSAITSPEQIKANRLQLYGDRHYQYDEYGNVIRELRGKRQHTEHLFKWDGQHRLIEFRKIRHYRDERDRDFHETVESVYRYAYDAFGRRISKTDNQTGDKTLFFWQGDRLITECHAEDANFHPSVVRNEHDKAENYRCRSYIYAPDGHGFSPLAQLNGRGRGGQIYYYFNDQLGTPQELVTVNGDIVWSAVYKSYGNLAVEYQSVPQPIRLPGQYFDEESGLHYNRYRYYDPYSARYFSQDPIGLEGGENAYSYVSNPLTWIDPLGLNGCPGTEVGKGTRGYLSKPEQGGTLNIGAGNKPIEGAYNISHPDYPMGHGVHPGNANDLSNIATGSQKVIIMENPYKYKPFNNEVLRVLDKNGTIIVKGSWNNPSMNNIEKIAESKGFTLAEKNVIPSKGYSQSNGKPIQNPTITEYKFIRN